MESQHVKKPNAKATDPASVLRRQLTILDRIERSLDANLLDGVDAIHANMQERDMRDKGELETILDVVVKAHVRINLNRVRAVSSTINEVIKNLGRQ